MIGLAGLVGYCHPDLIQQEGGMGLVLLGGTAVGRAKTDGPVLDWSADGYRPGSTQIETRSAPLCLGRAVCRARSTESASLQVTGGAGILRRSGQWAIMNATDCRFLGAGVGEHRLEVVSEPGLVLSVCRLECRHRIIVHVEPP